MKNRHHVNLTTGLCSKCGITITEIMANASTVCKANTETKEDNVVSLRRAKLEKYAKENNIAIVNLHDFLFGKSDLDTESGHAAIMDSLTEFAEAMQQLHMENEPQKPVEQFDFDTLDKLFNEVGSMGAGNADEECNCQACIDARSDDEQPLKGVPQKIAVLRSIQTVPFPLNNFTLSSDLREVLAKLFEDNLLEENDAGTHIIISDKGIKKLAKYDAQTAKMAKPLVRLETVEIMTLLLLHRRDGEMPLKEVREYNYEVALPTLVEHGLVTMDTHWPITYVSITTAGLRHVVKLLAVTV